jgi:hypothetical protein
MNHLAWVEYDLAAALALTSDMDAREIVQHVAKRIFDLELSAGQLDILSQFMITAYGDSETPWNFEPDLTNEYYVRMKVTRLVCLLSDFVETNLR